MERWKRLNSVWKLFQQHKYVLAYSRFTYSFTSRLKTANTLHNNHHNIIAVLSPSQKKKKKDNRFFLGPRLFQKPENAKEDNFWRFEI